MFPFLRNSSFWLAFFEIDLNVSFYNKLDTAFTFQNMPCLYIIVQAHNQKFFRVGKFSWNQDTSINILSKTQKEMMQENVLGILLPDTLNYILIRKFNPKMDPISVFSQKNLGFKTREKLLLLFKFFLCSKNG